MTVALAILVSDGIVMASDSATTLVQTDSKTGTVVGVHNVYDSANKIFNLHKGLPLGAYTFGAGSIGDASISTLAKDFRALLTSGRPIGPAKWTFKPKTYTVEDVAIAARHFLFEENYVRAYGPATTKPALGFNVGGYSAGKGLPELWQIVVTQSGTCDAPTPIRGRGELGITWSGDPEAIQRLLLGYGTGMSDALVKIGLPAGDVPAAIKVLQGSLEIGLAPPAMPIQDVIELAEFLVHMTIKFSKFKPGAPTVGGPIEVAAITKHERFKWVKRKHYFDGKLNPPA